MILWCDTLHDPAENMRRDARLLRNAEGGAEPVLRVFGFAPHGITLGANQRAERELDLERCAADGVPWALRPTGGRAIFHAEEWTYALAAPLDDPEWGGSRAASYARTSHLVVAALVRLGVPAAFAAGATEGSGPRARGGPAPPCFASTARHEVVLAGRKLVGSAQRRTARALLQQGSILLGPGHERLAEYLPLAPEARDASRRTLAASTAAAGLWIGAAAPLGRWADALAATISPRPTVVEGAAGSFLLTLPEAGSYTPRAS
jgi:lipoate-protein ligase A